MARIASVHSYKFGFPASALYQAIPAHPNLLLQGINTTVDGDAVNAYITANPTVFPTK